MVADILAAARAVAAPGVTLKELDAAAREILAKAGATSPFLNYHPKFAPIPYPAVICTSVNDAALHDIPGRYRLKDGDLLSVDCGATLDGWAADAAVSVQVGHQRPADTRLTATATKAATGARSTAERATRAHVVRTAGPVSRSPFARFLAFMTTLPSMSF